MRRRAEARVDLGAIERNAARLARELTEGAALCAVVKADGYGHGAAPAARAALAGGATWLAVATADEALALRAEDVEAPLLVMGALTRHELDIALAAGADVVAWREAWLRDALGGRAARVHVKLDTGMGRLGTRDAGEADAVCARAGDRLVGLMSHFATADERGDDFFGEQLERFRDWALPYKDERPGLVLHTANSAATLRDPASHFDMVRCGIAVYGMDPFHEDASARDLEPALELASYVADVKPVAAGESAGYGRRFVAEEPTRLATLPIGYGDGVRRALTNNAEVVIRGRRFPLVGTVSMDNVTVDVGDAPVVPGDDAVLIGAGISAEEVARRLDTINYEVTCGISARVPRVHEPGARARP
jgi:alanine racemase